MKKESNLNLKLALLLGYEFTYHGWISPGSTDEYAFKVMDNDDYQMLNHSRNPIKLMNMIEKKLGVDFEFSRNKEGWKLIAVHGWGNSHGLDKVRAKEMFDLIRQAVELMLSDSYEQEVAQVKKDYPWHYKALAEL